MPPDAAAIRPGEPAAAAERRWFLAALTALAAAAFCATFTHVYNYDIFWHLASGRWMLEHLSVLGTDPFSVDPEPRWVNVHWLFQVLVTLLHAVGGFGALSLLKALLAAGAMVLFAFALRGRAPAAWLVLCGLAMLLVIETRMRVRPEAFTILFLTVTIVLVEGVRRGGSTRRLWVLVPLMAAWVNMHGLYLLGPALFWSGVLGAAVDRRLGRGTPSPLATPRAAVPLALATAACLLSPWPLEAAAQPLLLWTRISGQKAAFSQGVSEFLPTWQSPYHLIAAGAIVLPAVAVCAARWRRAPMGHFVWLAAFAALALPARRNVALAGPVCGYLLALHGGALFRAAAAGWGRPAGLRRLGRALNAGAVLLAAAGCVACGTEWIFRVRKIHRRFGPGLYRAHYPIDVARRLGRLGAAGEIFCENWGDAGTFLYHSRPRRVWMDGRLEAHPFRRYLSQGRISRALKDPNAFARAMRREEEQAKGVSALRFFYVKALSREHVTAMSQSGDFRLLFVDTTGACFARTTWRDPTPGAPGEPLPAGTNLNDHDRPLAPDMRVGGLAPEPRRWYRQNPPSRKLPLGTMFLWLGWQEPRRPRRAPDPLRDRCTLLAIRYLTAARAEGLADAATVTGLLAVAHQQRALQERAIRSAAVPLDFHSARALYLYRRLDLSDLDDYDTRQFAAQHVAALVRAGQFDAAERAARTLVRKLPRGLPAEEQAGYEALCRWVASAVGASRRRAGELKLPPLERARALAGPDVCLPEQAIAELRAAPPTPDARLLLGDLLLNRGSVEGARRVYQSLQAPRGRGGALRLRRLLCDLVSGRFFEDGPAAPPGPAEAYYQALRLELVGRYEAALRVLREARPEDEQLAGLVGRLRSRLARPPS